MSWKIKYNNAKKVIAQIKNGEWVHLDSPRTLIHPKYPDVVLWVYNGGFFTDILDKSSYKDRNAFGLVFRHWVYYHIKKSQNKPQFEL